MPAPQSIQETFECLVEHGCVDMTSSIDSNKNSYPVIAAGGFGDVRRVALDNGTLVAVKTLRLSLLGDDDKALKVNIILPFSFSSLTLTPDES